MTDPAPERHTLLTKDDLYLFNEGSHLRLYEKLGARPLTVEGAEGTHFAVWAPNAERVSVVGDFNGWNPETHLLQAREASGIWEAFLPGVGKGALYKYHIVSRGSGYRVDKADPFGRMHEEPPHTASVVWDLEYEWGDQAWMVTRGGHNSLSAPIAIYEVHLGSWMRDPADPSRL
ncbi:MAG TPA: 1,4-alpha-glucan branching enzyme, partial [Thermoleophilia bacterium]|nr:1,4-alpha-glucan branching enzyme [Thermoleophilia bacterium]